METALYLLKLAVCCLLAIWVAGWIFWLGMWLTHWSVRSNIENLTSSGNRANMDDSTKEV